MKKNSFNNYFSSFLLEPSKDGLVELLNHHEGETDHFDFKEKWPEKVDLAKDILAFANSGGGCIVIGVAENKNTKKFIFEGLSIEDRIDKSTLTSRYESYIPKNLLPYVEIKDFDYENSTHSDFSSKFFSVLIIKNNIIGVPFMTLKDSDNKLVQGRIYIRRGTKTVEAHTEEINQLLEKKFENLYSNKKELDIDAHIKQLKVLYSFLPSTNKMFAPEVYDLINKFSNTHPDYIKFLEDIINKKKQRIKIELDINF